MSDDKPKRIRRPIVINGTSNGGSDLMGCYFLASDDVEGFYSLFNENGETLATGFGNKVTSFPFLHDGIAWTITDLEIFHHVQLDGIKAKGKWQNTVVTPNDAGTFQSESGGGAGEDDVNPSCVHPSDQIEIRSVTGGSDKDKLKQCFFLPTSVSGKYDLYDKDCKLLKSGLKTKDNFKFTHDSIVWTVTKFVIDDSAASGNWSNPDKEQNGSFQAESGGDVGESVASAASA